MVVMTKRGTCRATSCLPWSLPLSYPYQYPSRSLCRWEKMASRWSGPSERGLSRSRSAAGRVCQKVEKMGAWQPSQPRQWHDAVRSCWVRSAGLCDLVRCTSSVY